MITAHTIVVVPTIPTIAAALKIVGQGAAVFIPHVTFARLVSLAAQQPATTSRELFRVALHDGLHVNISLLHNSWKSDSKPMHVRTIVDHGSVFAGKTSAVRANVLIRLCAAVA